jgi:hypothetical protein
MKFETKFGRNSGQGWSEVHYHQSSIDPPDLQGWLNAFRTNVLGPRSLLLGFDCFITGVRVSYPRAGATASYGVEMNSFGPVGKASGDPTASIAVNFKDGTFTRTKVSHLRGFWDAVETNGRYNPDGDPDWNGFFTSWKDSLIAGGYGWPSTDIANSRKGTVVSYTQDTDGFVTFALEPTDPVFVGPPFGYIVPIKFSKLNNSKSPLNTQLLCTVDAAHTLRTIYPVGCGPFTAKGRYSYRAVQCIQYAATGTIKLGERKPGKRSDLLRGRSRVKAKY